MQFLRRISAILLFVSILIVGQLLLKRATTEEEVEGIEDRIISLLSSIKTQLYEFEPLVQTYRAELIAKKDQKLLLNETNFKQLNSRNVTHVVNRIDTASAKIKTYSIYNILPNLLENDDSLIPALIIGKNRMGVSIVMGIPTVKRPTQSYLLTTLQNLISGMTATEKNDTLVIIFIAESDIAFVQSTVSLISKQFKEDVHSGLIEIVSPSSNFYPDFKSLKPTLGDTKERTKWRSKQNLDYAYMMLYSQHRGTYYVQLEDDILAKPGYVATMKKFASSSTIMKVDWLMLDFCQLGFIGKMFRSADVSKLAEFFLLFYKDKPGDWLLSHFFTVKYCKLDQTHKMCLRELGKHWIHYKYSLFQHIGMVSSLSGKVQKLKDRQYGKLELFVPHLQNPVTSEIESTIKHYGKYSLVRAYEGKNYFWGLYPKAGDTIEFKYDPPVWISNFKIVSGNAEHPSDKLYNTTFEVQSSSGSGKYVELDEFDELGIVQGEISDTLNPILSLRILVRSSSDNWILISEIFFKEKPTVKIT